MCHPKKKAKGVSTVKGQEWFILSLRCITSTNLNLSCFCLGTSIGINRPCSPSRSVVQKSALFFSEYDRGCVPNCLLLGFKLALSIQTGLESLQPYQGYCKITAMHFGIYSFFVSSIYNFSPSSNKCGFSRLWHVFSSSKVQVWYY